MTGRGVSPKIVFASATARKPLLKDAKALLLDAQIDSQLEFYCVGREVNSSRYEGTDTKKPVINSL